MKICATCLYADNINRLCMRKNGMSECYTKHPHPHWRPRPADKLSPELRRMVEQAKRDAGRPQDGAQAARGVGG